jgi:hypothetical protein
MPCDCEDLRQIQAVIARIAQSNDLAQWDAYGEEFTVDAVMHCFGRDYVGREAVVAFTARRHLGKHMLSVPVVEIDGDRATVVVDHSFYRYPDLALFGVGVYKDQLVRDDGVWRISRREIEVHGHHVEMTAATKQNVTPIADTV